jgi:S1-C subfamily serine protease
MAPRDTKLLGATFRSLSSLADVSATGMQEEIGTYLVDVPIGSQLSKYGLKTGDVVLLIDRRSTAGARDFSRIIGKLRPGKHTAKVWRGQEAVTFEFDR